MKETVVLDLKIVLNEDFSFNVFRKGYCGCNELVIDFSKTFVDKVINDYLNYLGE